MTQDFTGPDLERSSKCRRVVSLREGLMTAGISMSYLVPDSVLQPELFDDHVDAAVRAFQQSRGLLVDGVFGSQTQRALHDAQHTPGSRVLVYDTREPVLHGDDVADLQRQLSHLGFYYRHIDGQFGPLTHRAVQELQENIGLPVDGLCSTETLKALGRVRRSMNSSHAFSLRAYEELARSSVSLRGRVIILERAGAARQHPGRMDRLNGVPVTESFVTADVSRRLEVMLGELGAQIIATDFTQDNSRHDADPPTEASLRIVLHCDWINQPAASGVATHYWGTAQDDEVRSPVGHRAAQLILRELVARTGQTNLGHHPRGWSELKSPITPSVGVDLGYLSSARDAANLSDPLFRQILADAILIGVQRLYLQDEDDHPTGTLAMEDVRRFNHAQKDLGSNAS